MKRSIVYLSLIFLSYGALFAQTSRNKRKPTVQKTTSAKNAATKPKREKFDPKRDPNVDLQNAVAKAKSAKKRIVLDIGGEWCGWCVRMDNYFLENPALAKMRDRHFVWLKVNFSPENENREFLSKYPEITGYPHLFVLESDGLLLHSQDTSALEESNNIITASEAANRTTTEKRTQDYDLYNFVQFLRVWAVN